MLSEIPLYRYLQLETVLSLTMPVSLCKFASYPKTNQTKQQQQQTNK